MMKDKATRVRMSVRVRMRVSVRRSHENDGDVETGRL